MNFGKIKKITILCSIILIFFVSILIINFDSDNIGNNDTANIGNNTSDAINIGNNDTVNIGNNTSDAVNINAQATVLPNNVCEGCHISDKGSVPQAMTVQSHLNGGSYCLVCHNFAHGVHPVNKDVTCEKCHGFNNETIPVSGPNIVCVNCHDYPNPLNKSFGNLVTIHRSRGISCVNCHADKCTKCHKEMGSDTRWEKRISHFKTILGNLYNGS